MAFENGTATDQQDFVDQLTTFASNNGWTLDEFDGTRDQASIHINSVFVHLRWDNSNGIAVFQSLGFNQEAASASVSAGGSGYTVGDNLTISGGTSTVAAVFNVDSVSGGAVTAVSLVTAGNYTSTPANPASTTGGTGTGCTLTVTYQGTPPEDHLDDSGNGDTAGTVDDDRRLAEIGNGPFIEHWFFASNEDGAEYLYAVLEYAVGKFATLGAGELVKLGTWTGGEWAGATKVQTSEELLDIQHNYVVDGRTQDTGAAATIHCEGLPGQDPSGKWGVVIETDNSLTDRAGNPRAVWGGGARESFFGHVFQGIAANPNNGFVPMVPYHLLYRTGTGGKTWRWMGRLPHIRELNGTQLVPGEEFTIGGSETWKVFPQSRKASSGTPHSGNAFFALRKIV